jgi:hypothetical protein
VLDELSDRTGADMGAQPRTCGFSRRRAPVAGREAPQISRTSESSAVVSPAQYIPTDACGWMEQLGLADVAGENGSALPSSSRLGRRSSPPSRSSPTASSDYRISTDTGNALLDDIIIKTIETIEAERDAIASAKTRALALSRDRFLDKYFGQHLGRLSDRCRVLVRYEVRNRKA